MSLLTQGQFLLARIYDPAGHLLGQAVSRQADRRLANYASPTPLPFDLEHARSQRVRIDTVSVLELSLPLVRDGHTWALLQGIYQASPANQKAIHDEILNGVALVVLAVLVTAIVVTASPSACIADSPAPRPPPRPATSKCSRWSAT